MQQTYSWQQKIRVFLIILFPVLITQVTLSGMNFFDTMMAGQAGAYDLAGVAIGTNVWMPVFTGFNGVLMAVVPILAQLYGAGRKERMPFVVIEGCYLALAIAVFTIVCGYFFVVPLLALLHLEPEVQDIARRFLAAIAWGIGPFFLSTILRSFIDTLGYTRVSMLITLSALPINVLLNYLLIFGKFGFPRLGGVGAGYASAASYCFLLLAYFLVISYVTPFKQYRLFHKLYRLSRQAIGEQLRIGVPIGVGIFCETSIFGVVALLMAEFGTVTIAAHQAAISFASLLYMLPLSISMALTIVVGFEVGAARYWDAKQYSRLGIGTALLLAAFCTLGLLYFSEVVARLYTQDLAVLTLTKQFLFYAAFFQLFDAIAAPIQGTLRGYKDVTVAFIMALVSYWVVGLPTGYYLSHAGSFGAFGYWLGFIAGLVLGAGVLSLRLFYLQRKLAE